MPPLTASDWVTIVTCICSSGAASVIANHISTALRDKKRFEDTPSVQARNTAANVPGPWELWISHITWEGR